MQLGRVAVVEPGQDAADGVNGTSDTMVLTLQPKPRTGQQGKYVDLTDGLADPGGF